MGRLTYEHFFLQNWNKFFGSESNTRPELIFWPDEARHRQTVLFGGIGAGKSRLITALVSSDAMRRVTGVSRRGFALLDNQEDLFRDVFDRLALLALEREELYELVYVIDPTNDVWSVKYNPLELMPWETPEAKASQLAMQFMYLFDDDPSVHVRQYRVSSLGFLALILAGKSLLDLPRFLTDREWREELVSRLRHPLLTSYWLEQFPRRDADANAWIESTMSRVERFVFMHDGIAFMLDGPSTINFRGIMDRGAFILINAPIRALKDSPSSLFLGFILAALQDAALSRTDIPQQQRTPFTAYCDEFQEYTTVIIQQIIRLSRKVRYDLFLASQDVQGFQKHAEVRELVRKLVGNVLAMRLSREDAEILVDYLATPDLVQEKAYVDGKPVFMSLPEIREVEIRKLTECPDRQFYWKRVGHPGSHHLRTPTVMDIDRLPNYHRLHEARQRLERAAFHLAGQPKWKRLPAPRRMSPDYGLQWSD